MKHPITVTLLAALALLFLVPGASANDDDGLAADVAVDPMVSVADLEDGGLAGTEEPAEAAESACSATQLSEYGLPTSALSALELQRNELSGGSCEPCASRQECYAYCGSIAVACVTDPGCGAGRFCFCF